MANTFEVITGFWKRRSAARRRNQRYGGSTQEEYWYGKPKLSEPLVINPGDELFIFQSTASNPTRGDPSLFLKVKRKGTDETTEQSNN